ncbi:MAG: hypothetical protein PHP28_09065 [Actinomycetota bacterium]|nr:hypothetical protein [Actinomycetota bacterium]MDD5667483.1 hypothetical protein [Actinomycetota bacterium]
MKRLGLIFAATLVVAALALLPGCGSESSPPPDEGGGAEGKAQALVFTQPG